MKHLYEGKTKTVFLLEDDTVLLKFKDDVTCSNGQFDPGANSTGIKIAGAGLAGLRLSKYFFEILKDKNIPTHYLSCSLEKQTMNVKKVSLFGNGIEVICRLKATGSFMRRYGAYAAEGQDLPYFVETTLKDDAREDPLIGESALEILNIMTKQEYAELVCLTKKITAVIAEELTKFDLVLYDIKFEFGKTDSGIVLVDEISGGNMRVYKNGKYLLPLELTELVLGK